MQKYLQICADIRVTMAQWLSPSLFQIFANEKTCSNGFKAILVEVKFDQNAQLKVLKRKLENIAQASNQSVKDYSDEVNIILIQLNQLGYPGKSQKEDFVDDQN
ncbi:hypothetical protein HDU84_001519, partial [Entophlyctis sp. JEL0112]